MAYENGTASGHVDMLDKLVTFLTTNATLVSANQEWEVVRYHKKNLSTDNGIGVLTSSNADGNPRLHRLTHMFLDTGDYGMWSIFCDIAINGWLQFNLLAAKTPTWFTIRMHESSLAAMTQFKLQYGDSISGPWHDMQTYDVTGFANGTRQSFTINTPVNAGWFRFVLTGLNRTDHVQLRIGTIMMFDANGDMVNAGEPVAILRARGTSGNEEILLAIHGFDYASLGVYNWIYTYMLGYEETLSKTFLNEQAGCTPPICRPLTALNNSTMPYWFVANGRRVVAVGKSSTNYSAMYLGYYLPYAPPSQFPIPIMLGGDLSIDIKNNNIALSHGQHRHFTGPGAGCASMRRLDGAWVRISNNGNNGVGDPNVIYSEAQGNYDVRYVMWPHSRMTDTSQGLAASIRETLGGRYIMPNCVIVSRIDPAVYGELEGCVYVSGFANAVEDIIQYDGVDHLVVQNVNRTAAHEFWALRLE